MNWVDRSRTSADERDVVWVPRCRDYDWGVAGSFFHWPFVSSWTVTLIILGLGFLRARLLRLCCTAAFPPIFLKLRKGPLWSCASFKLFWGMLGRGGDGGVLVLQDVGTTKSLHWRCEIWFDWTTLQLLKGLLWRCAELLQSYALCCVDQCGTVKLRLPRSVPRNCFGVCSG